MVVSVITLTAIATIYKIVKMPTYMTIISYLLDYAELHLPRRTYLRYSTPVYNMFLMCAHFVIIH